MAFITAETRSDLIALSVGMLKQAPSNALLEELIALSVDGGTLADAADHIAKTDAFKAEYPSFQTASQYAAEIFDNITTGGTVTAEIRTAVIDLATGYLTSGAYSKAGLALAIVDFLSQPAALLNSDFADIAQSVQNRSAAAEYFVVTKELGGSTDAELAAAVASVTSDAATLTAANAAADATADAVAVVPGQTFTLTTGNDVADAFSAARGNLASDFRLTDASETINAGVGTFTANDYFIDDSTADNDTLNVTNPQNGVAPTMVNIETVNAIMASGATAELDLTNITGVKTVFVSGKVDSTVSQVETETGPTVALDGYTRAVTVSTVDAAGTVANEDPDVLNLWVSGTTFGKTAASQSVIQVEDGSGNAGVIETVNIESAGTALNTFALVEASANVLDTVNISGAAPAVMIIDATQATGLEIVGAEGSTAIVSVDVENSGTLDISDFSNVSVSLLDSDLTGLTAVSMTAVDGQGASVTSDLTSLAITTQNTTTKVFANALSVSLDNSKDDTDLDIGGITANYVKAITIASNGNADEDSITAQNNIGTLSGHFNTITVEGDTSFAATAAIGGAYTGSYDALPRAVTIDATGLTGNAFADITVTTNYWKSVSYTVNGSEQDDALDVTASNTVGAKLNGNGGDDALTGALGADTIDGGAGDDTITLTYGADKVTGGAGEDTFDAGNNLGGTATAQVSLVNGLAATLNDGPNADIDTVAAQDVLAITVNGIEYASNVGANSDDAVAVYTTWQAANAAAILADHGVTVTVEARYDTEIAKFNVTGAGQVAVGDTIVLNIAKGAGAAADVTFTYTDSGKWDDGSSTNELSLSQDGTEFTLTSSKSSANADALVIDETAANSGSTLAAVNGGAAVKINITGSANGFTDAAVNSTTVGNDRLKFVGRADAKAFEVSAVFSDNTVELDVASSTTDAIAAPDLDTTITDIDATDIFDVSGLISGDVVIVSSLLDADVATASVFILTEDTYADFDAAEAAVAAVGGANDALVIWESSVTGAISMFYDPAANTTTLDTDAEQANATFITFTGVSTSDLSGILSVDSFTFG